MPCERRRINPSPVCLTKKGEALDTVFGPMESFWELFSSPQRGGSLVQRDRRAWSEQVVKRQRPSQEKVTSGLNSKFKNDKKHGKTSSSRNQTKSGRPWPPEGSPSKIGRTERLAGNGEGSEKLFGLRPVTEALRAGTRTFVKILVTHRDRQYTPIVQLAKMQGVPLMVEPREQLDRMVPQGAPSGSDRNRGCQRVYR